MDKIYLQMYSFEDFDPANNRANLQAAADMGFAGVELFGPNMATDAATMKTWLEECGLTAVSMHANTDAVISMIPYAKEVGLPFIGIGMQYMGSEEDVYAFAEKLNEIGKVCREEGLTLTYHNHTQELLEYNGKNILEILLENTDPSYLSLEVDAGWMAAAGVSPLEFVQKYGERIKLIHIKESSEVIGVLEPWDPAAMIFDENGHPSFPPEQQAKLDYSKTINCPAGAGIVDWKALEEVATAKGVQAYIVERETTYAGERIDCLKEDIAYYKSILF